ncbi:MAG: hypothetical protein AB1791_11600 [Chloroflexota bacterium]
MLAIKRSIPAMCSWLILTFVILSRQSAGAVGVVTTPWSPVAVSGFGDGGLVLTDFDPDWVRAGALAQQADGKLIVAGYMYSGSDSRFLLARYTPTGVVDTTFGENGAVVSDFGQQSNFTAVHVQSDGKIVAGGKLWLDFAIIRYNEDGSLDTSFNDTGLATISFGRNGYGTDFFIQPDGKIMAAGTLQEDYFVPGDLALMRLNPDGSLDTTFQGTGMLTIDLGGSELSAALTRQEDGTFILAATADQDFAVLRFNEDGSLDSTFNNTGIVVTDFGGPDAARDLEVQTDGKIVVAGNYLYSHYAMQRLNTDGSPDTSFDNDGQLVDSDTDGPLMGITLQPDGKIVVAAEGLYDFRLARYLSDGSLDTDFGGNGRVTTDFGGYDTPVDLVLQSDGKFVVAGYSLQTKLALARYLENGSLDFVTSQLFLPMVLHY